MPLYQYECLKGHQVDLMSSFEERNAVRYCEECGGILSRVYTPVRFWNAHQPGAVLSNGQTVRGHWGKDAPKKRRKK